jgi:CheY-like chemotaxis protein
MAVNILLVDDDAVQASTRKSILDRAGYSVRVSPNGPDALAFLQAQDSHALRLVITDHLMPGMNGAEFVQSLRKCGCRLPVIVLSGYADVEDQYDTLDVTCRIKPFPPDQLIALVQYLIAASERLTA